MKDKIEKLAIKIIQQSNLTQIKQDPKNYGIDPITIIIVIGVILSLVRVIQECKKTKFSEYDMKTQALLMQSDVRSLSIKNSWFNRLKIKKILRKHLSKDQYRIYGPSLINGLIITGANLTEEESLTLVEAI